MSITATEDASVTHDDRTVAKLTSPYQNKLDTVDALFGSVPATLTPEEAQQERLSEI